MRERWACPDLKVTRAPGFFNPVPGSEFQFDDCPAAYLRTAGMGLPAEHLIDGMTHPSQLVSEYAFEVESGSRSIETLSPKAREGVHLHLAEKRSRDDFAAEKRRKAAKR